MKRLLARYVPFVLVLCTAQHSSAATLTVRVMDTQGAPVANAVVEILQDPVENPPDEVAIIDQINKRFVPMVIAVQKGQRVNFPNNDNIRHHVYSFSDIKQFSTELYADIPGMPLPFDKAGIAVLGCNIHDSMVGYIYVSEWQHVAVSDAQGQLQLDVASLPESVSIWHPWSQDPDNRREVSTQSVTDGVLEIRLPVQAPEQTFGFRALSLE